MLLLLTGITILPLIFSVLVIGMAGATTFLDRSGRDVQLPDPNVGGLAWLLLGNAGTVVGVNFQGTTDDVDSSYGRDSVIAIRIAKARSAAGATKPGIIEGNVTGAPNTKTGEWAHQEGDNTEAFGNASHAEGKGTSTGAIGDPSGVSGEYSHAEGENGTATGRASHVEGQNTSANGIAAHAEGTSEADGDESHAEGKTTLVPSGVTGAHSEGYLTQARGDYSHAEGQHTSTGVYGSSGHTVGIAAHSEGLNTEASGNYSHSEGTSTTSQGEACHTEGGSNTNAGKYCHVEGTGNVADSAAEESHVEGFDCQSTDFSQHVGGDSAKGHMQCSFSRASDKVPSGARGSSQMEVFDLNCKTTNGTPKEMSLYFDDSKFVSLLNDTSYTVWGYLTARNSTTDTEWRSLQFMFSCNRGVAAANTTVDTAIITAIDTNTVPWTIAVDADTTNGRWRIKVAGEAAKTIYWGATVFMRNITA